MSFVKATKKKSRARVALVGPSGSGKTYTALLMAKTLGARVAKSGSGASV
jgi:ATP-dependent protease Clp ATPase subunit